MANSIRGKPAVTIVEQDAKGGSWRSLVSVGQLIPRPNRILVAFGHLRVTSYNVIVDRSGG